MKRQTLIESAKESLSINGLIGQSIKSKLLSNGVLLCRPFVQIHKTIGRTSQLNFLKLRIIVGDLKRVFIFT